MKERLIVVLGPTGSGKSDLAIKLAKQFNGEIISADSRQIYCGFIIGSGLIDGKWRNNIYCSNNIPHYLVQFLDPEKDFSVSEFKKLAIKRIKKIQIKKKLPFLTGGTGLYLDSITKNLLLEGPKANKALREKLETKSLDELNKQLEILDFKSAQIVDKKNKRRVIRAIEVCFSGILSSNQKKCGPELFNVLKIGIKIKRDQLYKKIDQRIDNMIENGLIREVEDLLMLYPKESPAFSGIGYRQVIEYLDGKYTEREMITKIKYATHAYARRQITWFKRDRKINWIKDFKEAEKIIKKFLYLK